MKLLELFSGIGGFAKGFERAGYKFSKHYFSEIDRHAIANYKYNFPNAEHIGSVTDVSGNKIERPDIITFGFPCQDLSIAGKRKGFDGKRSSLFYEAMRIIKETKPEIFIFENVKGLFSSNGGKDFTAVLRTIADLRLYECEWQMCNTKWLLPQNRERVYFIGHLRNRSKPRVFPIGESDFLHSRQNSDKEKIYTNALCLNAKGNANNTADFVNVIGNLKGNNGHNVHNVYSEDSIAPTVRENHGKVTNVFLTELKHKHGTGGDNIPYVHNTMPRSSKTGKGGTGHLKKNDGTVYNLDTGNTNAIELQLRYGRDNRSSLKSGRQTELGIAGTSIRRLTEIECERLQGFPDNWTQYGNYDGTIKKIAKSQRYKLLGNAVTVDIVKLIAERLKQRKAV